MKIQVTQEHIKNGYHSAESIGDFRAQRVHTCPVALAIREQTPFKNTSVHPTHAELSKSSNDVRYPVPLPPSATRFIHNYDNVGADAVGPFEFEL